MNAKFKIGQLMITAGALQKISPAEVRKSVDRHISGDWGEVCEEDGKLNDWAVENAERILSSYRAE